MLLPTMLREVYGESASSIYGAIFTFTGLSNLMIMCIVSSEIGSQYATVYLLSAGLSACSLILLLACFKEKKANSCHISDSADIKTVVEADNSASTFTSIKAH